MQSRPEKRSKKATTSFTFLYISTIEYSTSESIISKLNWGKFSTELTYQISGLFLLTFKNKDKHMHRHERLLSSPLSKKIRHPKQAINWNPLFMEQSGLKLPKIRHNRKHNFKASFSHKPASKMKCNDSYCKKIYLNFVT